MNIETTPIAGLLVISPRVFRDPRGFFMESWNRQRYGEVGVDHDFVQDNLSYSQQGILRGLHLQNPNGQGKLVQVLQGEVYDVAVDVRVGSPTFGQWHAVTLSADNQLQFFIPEGFAHGFCVVSETALFAYKCTRLYEPASELCVRYDDPDLGIPWPVETPLLSDKDRAGKPLAAFEPGQLPVFAA